MMHADAPFLAAIAADPESPAQRLIYADWLEEQGDVRADFIRLMEEMKTLPVHSDRFAELRPRRNELRQQLDPQWITQMGYQPTHRPMFTKLPEQRHERWRLVEEFIDIWYGPLQPEDGCSEGDLLEAEERLGLKLPAALREWHVLAGQRYDVWERQDRFVQPRYWEVIHDTALHRPVLFIRYENQWVERWGILVDDLALEDPPVFRLHNPMQVSPTVSAFALFVMAYEVKFSHVLNANAAIDRPLADFPAIQRLLTPADLPSNYWDACDPVLFHEGKDIFLAYHPQPEWVWVVARTEEAYQQLDQGLRDQLDRFHS